MYELREVFSLRRTHFPQELLDSLPDMVLVELELGRDAARLLCQSHAASGICVEGASKLDVGRRLWADGGVFKGNRVAQSDARRCKARGGQGLQEIVGEVRG